MCTACAGQRHRLTHVDVEGDWLTYNGPIDAKAIRRVKDLYKRHDEIQGLAIESEGGDVNLALDLAEWVRDNGLAVRVEDLCFSACANYVFPAGRSRILGPVATLGWHGASPQVLPSDEFCRRGMPDMNPESLLFAMCMDTVDEWRQRELEFFASVGVDPALTSAGLAAADEEYITDVVEGWTYTLDGLASFGLEDIEIIGGVWTPQLIRDGYLLCTWDIGQQHCHVPDTPGLPLSLIHI